MCQHISQLFLLRKNVVHHETFCNEDYKYFQNDRKKMNQIWG